MLKPHKSGPYQVSIKMLTLGRVVRNSYLIAQLDESLTFQSFVHLWQDPNRGISAGREPRALWGIIDRTAIGTLNQIRRVGHLTMTITRQG